MKVKTPIATKTTGGDRQSIGYSVTDDTGWSYQKTATDLGISKPAVVKAIQVAILIEQHPEYAELKGEQILRKDKIIYLMFGYIDGFQEGRRSEGYKYRER